MVIIARIGYSRRMLTYKNGKPIELNDYVRVDLPDSKSFWGWVKNLLDDNTVDLLDKAGKSRQASSASCSKVRVSKKNKDKKQLLERIIKITSDVAKTKRRGR